MASAAGAAAAGVGMAASMVPATLTILPPGIGVLVFPYHPEEYTITKTATWKSVEQPTGAGTKVYHGARASSLDIKIHLDVFAIPPSPPSLYVPMLHMAMAPTPVSDALGDSQAPQVMLQWGANIIYETAVIRKMSVTHHRHLLGVPIRSTVTLTLEEVPLPFPLPDTNPTSGGLATRRTHTVVEGDTLASIAYQEYRNPNKWRALAAANGIDDPMRIKPGTVLIVPDRREAESLA